MNTLEAVRNEKALSLSAAVMPPVPRRIHHNPLLESFSGLEGRTAIFGGTFDPVQNGHLSVARLALREMRLDRVVFIPAKQNPLKENTPGASATDRLKLLCAATEIEEGLYVSPIELNAEDAEPSFTINTLHAVRRQLGPDKALFMIVGSDVLPTLHKWHCINEVLSLIDGLITIERPGFPAINVFPVIERNFSPKRAAMIRQHFIEHQEDVSSSQVRLLLNEGESPSSLIPEPVLERIISRGLYRKSPDLSA